MYKFKIAQWEFENESVDLITQHRLCREHPEQIDWICDQLTSSNIIQEFFPKGNCFYNFSAVTYWIEIEDKEEAMLYRLIWG